jgi:hypothetical protein
MSTSSFLRENTSLPPAPWEITEGVASTPMEPLSGSFALATNLRGRYLTAVGGGGRTTDVIHTDSRHLQAWERFRLWVDSATRQYYALQTVNGYFITANNAGGLKVNAIDSTATSVGSWEMFKLMQVPFPAYAIQTLRGFFLTAVGGGGQDSGDTIHTDSVKAAEWEYFNLFRSADFGTESTYALKWVTP